MSRSMVLDLIGKCMIVLLLIITIMGVVLYNFDPLASGFFIGLFIIFLLAYEPVIFTKGGKKELGEK